MPGPFLLADSARMCMLLSLETNVQCSSLCFASVKTPRNQLQFSLLRGRCCVDSKLLICLPSGCFLYATFLFAGELLFRCLHFVSLSCRDFLASVLQIDPETRPTAEEAAKHTWIVPAASPSAS